MLNNFDFMCVQKQLLVKKWAESQKISSAKQKNFVDVILETKKITDYFIANVEPSINTLTILSVPGHNT